MSRTLHGAELAWLELMLTGAYPSRYGHPGDEVNSPVTPLMPVLTIGPTPVAAGDSLDLLDPEGVTLAELSVESTIQSANGKYWVVGRPEARTAFTHFDYADLRSTPDQVAASWAGRSAVALWGDPPLTFAVRAAARHYARKLDRPLLEIVPLPSDRETDASGHLAARLARLETTRDFGDQAVVVPDPGWGWRAREILARASVVAAYGASTLLILPERLADLGRDREGVEHVANGLGVELVPVAAAAGQSQLDPGVVDQLVLTGAPLPEWFAEPAVAETFRRLYRPRVQAGFTVLLSGLSGSGKSTVARHLAARLLEQEDRSVSLLDGDVVRHHLSKELGFTRDDRDTNVRRIGFVAAEITKAGGIALACPIAPYDATRKDVRGLVEAQGGFVLVHVATPLEECERRDRKGLYAKARRGEILEFTGISDPYEKPADADVVVDTTDITVREAVDQVMDALRRLGYLPGGSVMG